jgi:succinyl-CoA synthetase beta subunit
MRNLTEKEAEDFLEKNGFKVVRRILVKKKEELNKIKIKFPWVMKISSKHIVHKAKIGGTMLNIKSFNEAEEAFNKLKNLNHFEGIMVQEMLLGEEIIVGIKKTPEFEHVIMFGKGGSKVEEEKDISFRVYPISKEDTVKMMEETKIYSVLKEKKINLEKIEQVIMKLSLIINKNPDIEELDINPLIVDSEKAVVVDARISFD